MSKSGINAPELEEYYTETPKIYEGCSAPPNTDKQGLKELIIQKQSKFNEIEKQFGTGGNFRENVIRNKHTVIGASFNNTPQGNVIESGKRITAAVTVTPQGVASLDGGIPIVQEVDNWSAFPCGNYNITAGNRLSVRAGGGGVHMVSAGGASLISETVTKVGSTTQTLIGGESVVVTGNRNVTIEGGLLNLKSKKQVVVDSTLGVTGNVVVQGGIYSEGELFVNHITGPREIQQTLPGFTIEGAEAQLTLGNWIAGIAIMGGEPTTNILANSVLNIEINKLKAKYAALDSKGAPALANWPYFPDYFKYDPLAIAAGFPIYDTVPAFDGNPGIPAPLAAGTKIVPIRIFLGVQGNNSVELLPHAHEFPSVPMRLLESKSKTSVNNVMREEAIRRGINRANYSVVSEPIQNVPKYDKPGGTAALVRAVVSSFINIPGTSKSMSITMV